MKTISESNAFLLINLCTPKTEQQNEMFRIINVQQCRIAKSYSDSVSVEILRMRYILCTKSNAFLSINLCPAAAQSDLIKIDGIYKRKTEQQNKMFRIIDVQHCWNSKILFWFSVCWNTANATWRSWSGSRWRRWCSIRSSFFTACPFNKVLW